MPYLNRAIAEEQLGVNAASAGKPLEATEHYQAAIQVWNMHRLINPLEALPDAAFVG